MRKLFKRFLIKIGKLVLEPNDILVINIPKDNIPIENHQAQLDRLSTYIPDNKIILIMGDITLTVIKDKSDVP